jgi:hypothetical protein
VTGFIVMSRDAIDHPLLRDGERFRAWFWMVAKACWKPTKFDVHGKVVQLERGQFCCSVREMAEAWGWSKSAVDRFIQRLVDEDMVISTRAKSGTGGGTSSGTSRSIITICNYAKYQDVPRESGTAAEPPTGTAAGQQRDIKEQGNQGLPNGSHPKSARGRKMPIPDDWEPQPFGLGTDSRAVEDGWPPSERRRQLEQFKANHRAKGNTFADPQAAWSTWVLNSRKFGNARQHRNGNSSVRELGLQLAERRRGGSDGVVDLLPRLGSSGGHG